MHLLLLRPAKTTPPAAVPTLLAARRDHSSRDCISSCCLFIIYFNLIHSQELALVFSIKLFFRGIARCCRQRLLLLPPPCKWSRFGNEWRRHKSRRRRLGQANRQLAFCITRSSRSGGLPDSTLPPDHFPNSSRKTHSQTAIVHKKSGKP